MKKKYSNFKKSNKKKYNIPTSGKKSNKKYILKHNNRKLIKLKKNKKSKVGKNNKNNTPLKGGKKNNNNNNNDNNNDNNDEGNNYNNNNNNGDNDNDNNLSNILGKDSKLNNVDLFSQSKNSDNQSSLSTTTSTTNSNSNSSMGASALKSTLNNLGDNLNIDNLSEEELKMLIAGNNNDNNSEPNYYNTLSFEEKVKEIRGNLSGGKLSAMVIRLDDQLSEFNSGDHALQPAKTGWFISQDTSGNRSGVDHELAERLFRLCALQEGFQASRELVISIERIEIPRAEDPDGTFGSFSVIVNEIRGTRLVEVERFDRLNLDPTSDNYIAKKIGTQYYKWDGKEKRNKIYGTHRNVSEYVRVEMAPALVGNPPAIQSLVPFGFLGPVVPEDITKTLSAGDATLVTADWTRAGTISLGGLTKAAAGSNIRLQWPTLPLVNSGSLSDGFMMGASPYKQNWSDDSKHTTSTILNPGYIDYIRRASEFQQLTADQDSGVSADASTKQSFVFTLDDVILHPKPAVAVSNIDAIGDVVLAEYVSGSRNGVGDSEQSSALLKVSNATDAHGMTAGQSITLTSNDGSNTQKKYVLVDPTLSDADTTAGSHSVIAANAVIGDNANVTGAKGTLANVLTIDGGANGDECQITVPVAAGGAGAPVKIKFVDTLSDTVAADTIELKVATLSQMNLLKAVDGGNVVNEIKHGSGIAANGVAGLVGSNVAQNANHVGLSLVRPGDFQVIVANNSGNIAAVANEDIFSATASGTAAGAQGAGPQRIAVHMTGTQANVLANLKAAIASSNGHSGKIVFEEASSSDSILILKQQLPGVTGDTSITDGDPANPISNLVRPDAFSGGRTAKSSYARDVASTAGKLRTLLEIVDGFRAPMVGGFDGVNIIEADPFNNRILSGNDQGSAFAATKTNYAYASVDRAIQLISDAEMVEHNLAVMPGITNASLTTELVRSCEARSDSLAIIDLPDVYVPPFEKKCDNFEARMPSAGQPRNAAKSLVERQLNSSYGATYYPWVKIKDEVYNRDVWVPPSVVALGVMAFTEERDEVWFAPAGFNRGGLNEGNAGLPVLQVTDQLMSKDRDTLYAANINPIASFVSEGIVIFGQKTLQSTQSALDRINVRRLLIFVKKRVSQISKDLLFEQNVRATWNKFLSQVNPFLESVKTRFGLSDYKVVLDSTTTTPDLVDRNILYAKVLLKPARAIEFIAVDFVITNTGASFADL